MASAFKLRDRLERARIELVAAMAALNTATNDDLTFAARRLWRAERHLSSTIRRASRFLRAGGAELRGSDYAQ